LTLSASLSRAIHLARTQLGDPLGRVWVITPSVVAAELARRELGAEHDILDVRFTTPARLVAQLAEVELALAGRTPFPAGWHRGRVEALLEEGAIGGRFATTLQARGWAAALARLTRELQSAGVTGTMLRTLDLAPDLAERCVLVADLLDALAAMATDEGHALPVDVADAAKRAMGARHPLSEPGAVVLLGDARLPRLDRVTLGMWLHGRPTLRLALAPLEALPLEPMGLLALAPDATIVPSPAAPPQIEVFATPDEVREASAIARIVQAALSADPNLALDRVAIVLPDTDIVEPLAAALTRAGIPATWQIGRPVSETPAGRFVGALLALRDDSPPVDWYALLTEPGLRLSARLGAQVTQGRGRWRRLLAPLRNARSVLAVLAALDRSIEAAVTGEESREGDLAALRGLRTAIVGVRQIVSPLRSARSAGALAAMLHPLLDPKTGWWRRAPDTARLSSALEILAQDGGRPSTFARAATTLLDAITETPLLAGALTDPAVRVLEPMSTLGGSFELVVLGGLVHGRFPRDPSEDPILTDTVRDALRVTHGISLPLSTDQPAAERRRLAAVLSASRNRLVGLVPRADFAKGRPSLVSPFARELASLAAGRELGFAEMERSMPTLGSRAGVPPAADDALGSAEYLAARLAIGDGSALSSAVSDPCIGRTMRRARALGRLAEGELTKGLLPYLGVVPTELVPLTDGWDAPMPPWQLQRLVTDPEGWLLGQLGVRSLTSLRAGFDPTNRYAIRDRLLSVLAEKLADGRTSREGVLVAAAETLREELTMLGFEGIDAVVHDAQRACAQVLGDPSDLPPRPGLSAPTVVDPQAPFVIEGGDGLPGSDTIALVGEVPGPKDRIGAARSVALEALARNQGLSVRALDDRAGEVPADALGKLRERVRATAAAVEAGWFPSEDTGTSGRTSRPPRNRLTDDRSASWVDPDASAPVFALIEETSR